ncbi:glycosyltransferase family 2 protein [Oenococcus alcoholitolerans]|uniref:glycosyltransferase family 2 protein n=1 Tax=Oenococcus alcoholitolerans TaxID=931074 RepID=UPI003F6FB990
MNFQPTVDVVIPTYERPLKYSFQSEMLFDAIKSVLNQTYPVNSIFVVADGKSPSAKKIVKKFSDDKIIFLETGEKKGGGSARNVGIRASKSDFVAFLDDDDIWRSDKIEKQVFFLSKNRKKDMAFCFTQVKSEEKNDFQILPNNGPENGMHLAEYIFLHHGYITTSTIMASRELLLKNPFTEGLPKHQDWDWIFKADFFCKAQAVFLDIPLTIYRTQYLGRSMSVSQRNTWKFSHDWISKYKPYLSQEVIMSFDRGQVIPSLLNDHNFSKYSKYKFIRYILLDFSYKERFIEWKNVIIPFIYRQLKGRYGKK